MPCWGTMQPQQGFDCVNHNLLLWRLADSSVRGILLGWLESSLKDRRQYVKEKDGTANLISVNIGVPQASVLAPLLFILYVNDMLESIDSTCASTMCADDTSVVISHVDDSTQEAVSNQHLQILLNWYNLNSLCLNPSKSKYIRFHSFQKHCIFSYW